MTTCNTALDVLGSQLISLKTVAMVARQDLLSRVWIWAIMFVLSWVPSNIISHTH